MDMNLKSMEAEARLTQIPAASPSPWDNITTESDLEPWEEEIFNKTIFIFDKCLPPVLISIGIIGNVLAFLVLRRPKYCKQSTCVYMRALTFFDSFTLIFYTLQRYLLHMFPDKFWSMGSFFCKEFIFIAYFSLSTSHWALVLMTIDRFIAVKFPLKSVTFCTTKRARVLITVMTLVFAAFHFQHFWRVDDQNGNVLRSKCPYDYEVIKRVYEIIYQHLFVVIVMIIPLLIVVVLNILIVYTVRNSHKRHKELGMRQSSNCSNGHRWLGTDRQITFMLLLVSWVFAMAITPFILDHIVWDVAIKINVNSGKRRILLRTVLYEVALNVLAINPSCNFYMYCLGCRKFRLNLRHLFIRKDTRSHERQNGMDLNDTDFHGSLLDSGFSIQSPHHSQHLNHDKNNVSRR